MNNPVVLLCCSMAANLLGTVLKKYVTNRTDDPTKLGYIFNTVSSAVAAAVLLGMNGFHVPSAFTVVLGILFGVITALQQLSNVQALKLGPLSYTTVLCSLSTLIPTLCGAIIWNERIAPIQWCGICLMVGCFLLSVSSDPTEKKASLRWLGYCAVLFLCTGGIGVMQKWHQNTVYKEELDAFLLIAFVFSTVYSGIGLLLYRRKTKIENTSPTKESANSTVWILLALIAVCGVCAALNNKWNLYLSGVMESVVFFPVVNGGGLILTTLSALLLFRERLGRRQWIGIVLGILSVLCLCNPFT